MSFNLKSGNTLLVNPPIYDFAAYDLWAKPLGLLYLSSILKANGASVTLLDYTDRHFSGIVASNRYGCGSYNKQEVEKPKLFAKVPRKYSRYGISADTAEQFLRAIPKPDVIIVTSIMTYWYLGVIEAIDLLKKIFPNVPVVLGGIYATLCYDHAVKNTKADYVIKGGLINLSELFHVKQPKAAHIAGLRVPETFAEFPVPDYSLYKHNTYAALRMSRGCPMRCSYCAQHILNDKYEVKPQQTVAGEILHFYNMGIHNIAFYDDALLYNNQQIKKVLETIIKTRPNMPQGLALHTPNGLAAKHLDLELAGLMHKANFVMPRFSLETSNPDTQHLSDGKITNDEFEFAINCLQKAGYKKGEYMAYLLMGLPNQSLDDVEKSVRFANKLGAKISISEYSPIPHTASFNTLDNIFKEEPLLGNNSAYPTFTASEIKAIHTVKNLAENLNNKVSFS
jgi:radical SAM superfamily enzyme YgiQ (UPF0313 family)